MPLGITESTLRRAYGPLDLSYSYQRLEATQKLLAAEEKAKREELAKQYYTDMASLKKDFGSVRQEDIGDIIKKYNRWSQLSKQLASNPNLINRNGELYGKLKGEADTLYGEVIGDISESKEMKKMLYDTGEKIGDVRNFDILEEDAFNKFKTDALLKPTKELIKSGKYSFNSYLSPIVDGKAFFDAAQKDINDKAIVKEAEIEDIEYKDPYGTNRKKFDKIKNVPVDVSIYNIAAENLGRLKNRASAFARQRVEELESTGEAAKIQKEYNDFYALGKNKGFGSFLNQDSKLVYNPEAPVKDRYAKLYAMSEFLDRAKVMTRETGQPTKLDEVRKMFMKETIGGKDEKVTEEVVDLYTPAVNTINSVHKNPKFTGKNVTLESFDERIQNQALQVARNRYSPNLVLKHLSLNYNPSKQSIQIFSRAKIDDVKIKPGDYLGEMSKEGLFIKGNVPAGQKVVREAIKVAGKTNISSAKPSAKKQIPGWKE